MCLNFSQVHPSKNTLYMYVGQADRISLHSPFMLLALFYLAESDSLSDQGCNQAREAEHDQGLPKKPSWLSAILSFTDSVVNIKLFFCNCNCTVSHLPCHFCGMVWIM